MLPRFLARYDLEAVQDTGIQLVECCGENPAIVSAVNDKVSSLKVPLDKLAAQVEQRQAKLQEALLQSQEFQDTLDELTDKLGQLEDSTSKMLPVSSVYDVVREQNKELECAIDDVHQLEPVVEKISKSGSETLASLEPGSERDELEAQLDDITSRWQEVKKKVSDRKEKLDQVTPVAKKYADAVRSLEPWISATESKLSSMDPISCDEKSFPREEKIVEALNTGLAEHKPNKDSLNEAAKTLSELAEDVQVTQAENKDLNKRWDALTADVAAREEQLEAVKHVVEELHGTLEPIEHTLDEAEDIFSAPASYGTNVDKSADELRKVEVRFCYCVKQFNANGFCFARVRLPTVKT